MAATEVGCVENGASKVKFKAEPIGIDWTVHPSSAWTDMAGENALSGNPNLSFLKPVLDSR
jgi:hypothetical protein